MCGALGRFLLYPALGSWCKTAMFPLPLCGKPVRREDGWSPSLPPADPADQAFPFGRFDTEEEAVAIANAADVGLAGRRPCSARCSPFLKLVPG